MFSKHLSTQNTKLSTCLDVVNVSLGSLRTAGALVWGRLAGLDQFGGLLHQDRPINLVG